MLFWRYAPFANTHALICDRCLPVVYHGFVSIYEGIFECEKITYKTKHQPRQIHFSAKFSRFGNNHKGLIFVFPSMWASVLKMQVNHKPSNDAHNLDKRGMKPTALTCQHGILEFDDKTAHQSHLRNVKADSRTADSSN